MNNFGEPWRGVEDTIETVTGPVAEVEVRRREMRERAIACVNALAGIDDPEKAVKELVTAFENHLRWKSKAPIEVQDASEAALAPWRKP